MINKIVAFSRTPMSSRQHNIIVLSVAFIIAGIFWIPVLDEKQKEKNIKAKFFQGSNGWGYDILVDDDVFIHQESVPTISGKVGFATRRYAEKAASLVIEKMAEQELPTLNRTELKSIAPLQQLQYDKSGKNK